MMSTVAKVEYGNVTSEDEAPLSSSSSSSASSSSSVDDESLIGSGKVSGISIELNNEATFVVAVTSAKTASSTVFTRSILVWEIVVLSVFLPFLFAFMLHSYYEHHLIPLFQATDFLRENKDRRSSSELTYYHRKCESVKDDMTATSPRQLLIDPNLTPTKAATQIAHHGVGFFPNVVSQETAEALRDYVIEENTHKQSWFVLEQDHRYTWGLDVNMHPSIQTILQEIASHELLIPTIEQLVGTKDPAIIEFSIIGASYGAKDQNYHPDVYSEASGAKYIRTFTTPHTLFIPLQDTTYKMGATQICPGSHLCAKAKEYCEQYGFPISTSGPGSGGNNETHDDSDYDGGIWNQGYAAIYNQQMFHRGAKHIDPNGPERVILVMTFVSRPTNVDQRQISLGGTYSIPWYLWGNTFSDYNVQQWGRHRLMNDELLHLLVLRSLGLIKGNGWNLVDTISSRSPNEDYGFTPEELASHFEANTFWFIPRSWRGVKTDSRGKKASFPKFLRETLRNTTTGMAKIYAGTLCGYTLSILYLVRSQGRECYKRRLSRAIWLHCIIFMVLSGIFYRLKQNTRRASFFRLPKVDPFPSDYESLEPAVLPYRQDVLISEHYASKHLGAYSKVLDHAHPGNKQWLQLIHATSVGYGHLSPALQAEVQRYAVKRKNSTSRFLKQDALRRWIKVEREDELNRICHKQLVMSSDPLADALLMSIDTIQADAHWKYGSNMDLISTYVTTLEDHVLRVSPFGVQSARDSPVKKAHSPFSLFRRRVFDDPPPAISSRASSLSIVPPIPETEEPFDGAWLMEGDILEGMLRCKGRVWKRGKLVRVHAHNATYDIDYDDGKVDRGLSSTCVRRYVPHHADDIVWIQETDGTNKSIRCKVFKVYDNPKGTNQKELYDLVPVDDTADSPRIYQRVPPNRIRRIVVRG